VHQLAEREQRIQCAVRLEGIVLWASAAGINSFCRMTQGRRLSSRICTGRLFNRVNGSLWLATAWRWNRLILGINVVDNDGLHI